MNPCDPQCKPKGHGKDICSCVKEDILGAFRIATDYLPAATLVTQDLEIRAMTGEKKYGERLLPHNGRNALLDAYQESCDLLMYLRQDIEERPTGMVYDLYRQTITICVTIRMTIMRREME